MKNLKILLGYLILLFMLLYIPFLKSYYYIPIYLYILGHAIVYVCVRHLYRRFRFRGFINLLSGLTLLFCYSTWVPKYCNCHSGPGCFLTLIFISLSFFWLFFGIRGGYVLFGQNEYHEGMITILF